MLQDLLGCDVPFPHINTSVHKNYREYYNASSIKLVEEMFLFQKKDIQRKTIVKSILYQTSKPSFSSINLPNTPVKPARNMAKCNFRKACFIEGVPIFFDLGMKKYFSSDDDIAHVSYAIV